MDAISNLITAIGFGGTLAILIVVYVFPSIGEALFGEFAAGGKIRREFADATAKQVASLANQHYWTIANAAGTLSGELRSYLEAVEICLYLDFAEREHLDWMIADVGKGASSGSFPTLVQFVCVLHSFQFEGSNDYLLPDRSASTHLRRLYNSFRVLIKTDSGDDLATRILQLRKKYQDKDGKFDLEKMLNAASQRSEKKGPGGRLIDRDMELLRRDWAKWLRNNLPSVLEAANALEAFSRLLQYQLAMLYKHWFHDEKTADELANVQDAVERKRWFGVLTRAELATLAIAREQDDFMTALRRTASGLAQARGEPERKTAQAKAVRGGPSGSSASEESRGLDAQKQGAKSTFEQKQPYVRPEEGIKRDANRPGEPGAHPGPEGEP